MPSSGFESLRTAKAAFDEGLIDEQDVRLVRTAFLRAQQIRAGLDAGFFKETDYEEVKRAFLNALSMAGEPTSSIDALPSSSLETPQSTPRFSEQQAASQPDSRQIQQPLPTSGQHHQSQNHQAPNHNGSRGHGIVSSTINQNSAPPPARIPTPPPARVSTPPPGGRGNALIPTDIPKMGGARPKQTGSTSMSGISVTEDAVNLYYYLKAKSVYRWALWKINDAGNQVIISEVGDRESGYADFLSHLPATDCRYGVIDMRFVNSEGCVFNKILFINWAPDTARIKAKMMYASTKDFFKGYLDGLSIELQGGDLDDISEQEANNAVRSSVTRQ